MSKEELIEYLGIDGISEDEIYRNYKKVVCDQNFKNAIQLAEENDAQICFVDDINRFNVDYVLKTYDNYVIFKEKEKQIKKGVIE